MKHILVFAYQLSPYLGSEFSVAWNYVINMSRNNRLTVLYGVSEGWIEIGNIRKMQEYLRDHKVENVTFVNVDADEKTRKLLNSLKDPLLYYKFYAVYHLYQKTVADKAREIISREKVDIIHYLGPIGYHEPGYLKDLGLPYIWGPIGGFTGIPLRLIGGTASFSGGALLAVKKFVNILRYNFDRRIRRALKQTDLLLTCHSDNKRKIERLTGRRDVIVMPENCINEMFPLNESKFKTNKLECIWVGSIDSRKALKILISALAHVDKDLPLNINIVGQGPLEHKLKAYAEELGVAHFLTWHGKLDRGEVFQLFNNAHLHIITSLNEACTTVIWEAMSMGVPTMSLGHCGMKNIICDKCGIRIPVRSMNKVCRNIAAELENLVKNPARVRSLAEGVLECRRNYTWERRRDLWEKYYDMAIEKHNSKKSKF